MEQLNLKSKKDNEKDYKILGELKNRAGHNGKRCRNCTGFGKGCNRDDP